MIKAIIQLIFDYYPAFGVVAIIAVLWVWFNFFDKEEEDC